MARRAPLHKVVRAYRGHLDGFHVTYYATTAKKATAMHQQRGGITCLAWDRYYKGPALPAGTVVRSKSRAIADLDDL
jgi:hypothetical protein